MRFNLSLLVLMFLVSCGGSVNRYDLLPDASGAHGSVILIMEDDLWNSQIGAAVMYHLDQNAKGVYLRPEPMFDVSRVAPDNLNHLNQLNRLLLKVMIDNDSTYQQTAVIEKPNYFAKGQMFILVKDSDIDRLYSFVVNEFAYVVNKMNKFELDSYINYYREHYNRALMETAKKNFNISICVPDDSEVQVDSADFLWAQRDRSRHVMPNSNTVDQGAETYWIQQGILIWKKPYTDTTQLTYNGVISDRDTVLKYHVPGKLAGSYMATEMDSSYMPKGKVIDHQGAYGLEMKGLWRHAGNPAAFGGGPFTQYTLLDEKRQQVVTVCIYCYGPNFNKREYIREGDAMLQTIEFMP